MSNTTIFVAIIGALMIVAGSRGTGAFLVFMLAYFVDSWTVGMLI